MSQRQIESYETTIKGRLIEIIVYETSNVAYPYYAIASLKKIDGAGKTVDEAKRKCEVAVKMDILTNS